MNISFCVIAYNEENTIKSLFKDIKNQDYPHHKMEIVLVNSMSTDSTKEVMEEFADETKGFLRIIVVDNPKRNQASGWNVAIREAQGDVIIRIDAHTMIPSNFVSKSVACLERGENITGGPRPNIAEEDTPWKHTLMLAEDSLFGSSIAPYRKGHHRTYVKSVFHGAYRREVFEKAGLFNEALGRTEDNEMHYRIRQAGYKICYDPQIISYQHTRNTWKKMIKQKYGNGYWIGLTLGICPRCFSLYHFIPFCFVLALLAGIILLILGTPVMLIIVGGAYLLVNIFMSVIACIRQKKYLHYFMLPLIFVSLHMAYGVGTLVGLIRMPFWKRKIKELEMNVNDTEGAV